MIRSSSRSALLLQRLRRDGSEADRLITDIHNNALGLPEGAYLAGELPC